MNTEPVRFTRAYEDRNGILDFINDSPGEAYTAVSGGYDALLTDANVATKLYNKAVWGISDMDYVPRVMDLLQKPLTGTLLDVPVGTAVFTRELYWSNPGLDIYSLDYSPGMIVKAKERLAELENVTFIRGDAGNLPFEDGSFDTVLSMNGFHAFPDKTAAVSELARVLKPGGRLVSCFYIKDRRRFTDWWINHIYVPQGTFTPPFWSMEEAVAVFSGQFDKIKASACGSIFYFSAEKK